MWWIRFILIAVGYLFGLVQTGYFYGKITGTDLRKNGSGNTGATNALRVMGIKGALIVFFFDALKAFIPCFAVRLIFKDDPYKYVYLVYTALGVILGNDYPFYLKFKGGKGVAATCGWYFAWQWQFTLVGLALFFSIAFATGYVSLASIISALYIIGAAAVFGFLPMSGFGPQPFSNPIFLEFFFIVVFLSLLMIWRHKGNVKRLLTGTENRFGKNRGTKKSLSGTPEPNCDNAGPK